MPLPSRSEVEGMAFKALMGSIGIGQLPCDCPSCSKKSRAGARSHPLRRTGNEKDSLEPAPPGEPSHGSCGHHHPPHQHHHHHAPEPRPSLGSRKGSGRSASPGNPPQTAVAPPGRNDKINSLLKAETTAAIFDVFNATATTNEEKELVAQIQNVTQDSKTYPDSKTKIMKLCDSDKIVTSACAGLLAKFRHERNLLTTAILKSNTEREKALLCIKRVDDLMYMLSDVSKRPKDANSEGLMASLGEIIMEVHEIAKHPSVLYEELLDIRDDHLQLLDDHDDMHAKFMDVNSCHDKLHANHEKLQSSHAKLTADHIESKKKAGMVNGLKQDVVRLEKALDKKQDENSQLKKEIEKLTSEMAKVNALKHEVAQLKKKITTFSTQSNNDETVSNPPVAIKQLPQASGSQETATKKKKGKKGNNATGPAEGEAPKPIAQADASDEKSSNHETVLRLQESYEVVLKELASLRANLAQIHKLRQQAEIARDEAIEKLQVEQATSENWQQISNGHAEGKAKLEGQLEHCKSVIQNLQLTTKKQEEHLSEAARDLSQQKSAYEEAKARLNDRSCTPAISEPDRSVSASDGALRLLHKIKGEIMQLTRDVDSSLTYNVDLHGLLSMIHGTVHRIGSNAAEEIDHLLGNKSTMSQHGVSENTMPPAVPETGQMRSVMHQTFNSYDYSPRASPNIPFSLPPGSVSTQPFRPSIPPGFTEPSPTASSLHSFGRLTDSPMLNAGRHPTPSSTTSILNSSPSHAYKLSSTADFGPIGSRIPSSSMHQPFAATKLSDNKSGRTPPPGSVHSSSLGANSGGLGNGAHGVDWNMWSKSTK